jgi:predicted acylesterase/phospholipase RssA
MAGSTKEIVKRRGFVMTGGGAKGLYEAGVIHAFHISGMEFDVITGSSIGAMNSVFYAEYLFHKSQLEADVLEQPEQAVDALDSLVKAFHHAWLSLPEKRIIDDSEEGPLGGLKDDLLESGSEIPARSKCVAGIPAAGQ